MFVIEIDCLSKRYVGGTLARDGVSLSVQPGEVFGTAGPQRRGGKLGNPHPAGHGTPDAGRASVMGFDAQDDPVAARRLLGYLHGNPKFYGKMTAAGPAVLPGVPPTLPGGIAIPPGFIPPGFPTPPP